MKWIGSMLVLFAAGGFGIWSAMQWRERLRLLEKLRQMIYFLKGEITYSHAPLARLAPWDSCLRLRQRESAARKGNPCRRYGEGRFRSFHPQR